MQDYPKINLFIGGDWVASTRRVPVLNPATEEALGDCPLAELTHLEEAVNAAHAALVEWQRLPPLKRSGILRLAAASLRADASQVAGVMVAEQGKLLDEALAEVERACEIIEWDAEEARRLYGRVIESGPGVRRTILREPIGVVAAFSAANAPLANPARKLSAPLAAGCSVVLKANQETPGCAVHLVRAFEAAGIPRGLVNLVFGGGAAASDVVMRHKHVRAASYTGSVKVGKQLAALCGEVMKPVVMELGGHAPVIIDHDADIARTAALAIQSKQKNAGQICTSPTRFLVHRSRLSEFVDHLKTSSESLAYGSGIDPESTVGPLASARQREWIRALIEDAVSRGATATPLGGAVPARGFFHPITLLTDVPPDAHVMSEEPFGSIIIAVPYDELDQAVELANSLPYALAAYVFSQNAATVEQLTDKLECGNLGINTFLTSTPDSPLGGLKDSGFGREGGQEGMLNYTYLKNVARSY